MEFTFQGNRIKLQGLTHPQSKMVRPASLRKVEPTGAQFYQLTIESKDPKLSLSIGSDGPIVFLNEFCSLLQQFGDIFNILTGLPPIREQDHRIPLTSGAAPVNVKP